MSYKEKMFFDQLLLSQLVTDDSEELIELVSQDDNEGKNAADLPDELSILPVRNTVLFPGVVMPRY